MSLSERDRRLLLGDVQRLFSPPSTGTRPRRIGAEVELIPVVRATHEVCRLAEDGGAPTAVGLVRLAAAPNGWQERASASGVPSFRMQDGGQITFEPGGQIEISSAPYQSASALIDQLDVIVKALDAVAANAGIELISLGIDPYNDLDAVPLQIFSERYVRMDELFGSVGASGARMMRQTASMHVNVDSSGQPEREWRVLNAMAPYLIAIFANSSRYAGQVTEHQSFRAHCWRTLEPTRTGLPYDESDAARGYLDFALDARSITIAEHGSSFPPFREWIAQNGLDIDEWHTHLTTLFPEIRPRGYFEVRCIDALQPELYSAPIALLGGLLNDAGAFAEMDDLLGDPDPALLIRAGLAGLHDPDIATVAADVVDIALRGCERLGSSFLDDSHLEAARAFFDRYTRHGRSPADDARDLCPI